jgi:DNA-binding transcriptional MerR regulator
MTDGLMRVGEAAKALGVTPKTLRFYEAKGILPSPRRNGAGYRMYAPEDLERARLVLRLKAMGLQLDEAREVLACAEEACCGGTGPRLEETLHSKLAEIEDRIRELTALRTHLREALSSLRSAVERNRSATECDEDICLPRVEDGADRRLLPLAERQQGVGS